MLRAVLPTSVLLLASIVLALAGDPPVEKKEPAAKKKTGGLFGKARDKDEPPKSDPFDKSYSSSQKEAPKPLDPAEADRELLKENQLEPTAAKLIAFFRGRSLADSEVPKIESLARQLGGESFVEREDATRALLKRGPAVAEFLRKAIQSDDLEAVRRAERCLTLIRDADLTPEVRTAAVRTLGRLDPPEAVAVLLAFFPYADHDLVADEVRQALAKAPTHDGRPHAALVAALTDAVAARRGVAGEVLARFPDTKAQVKPLLKDPEPIVRLRVAQGLVLARDADAVPALIDAIPDVAASQAWNAKDLLLRLGEGKSPPMFAAGVDPASRKKYRDAWHDWWQKNKAGIDLARLEKKADYLGHTVLVLLDQNEIVEMNKEKKILWRIGNLGFPLDLQILPTGNILVAEYQAGRVTERDTSNNIYWSKEVTHPLMAQRLEGGRTFVATDTGWHEFDRDGTELGSVGINNGNNIERMMKVAKLPNGNVVALTTSPRVVWFDSRGKEITSFPIHIEARLFGGRLHVQPNGRVLVPFNNEEKVVEFDQTGRQVWSVSVPHPVAAVRLANGNTLVTSMLPETGAVEFDAEGREVWSYQAPKGRVTRALKR